MTFSLCVGFDPERHPALSASGDDAVGEAEQTNNRTQKKGAFEFLKFLLDRGNLSH